MARRLRLIPTVKSKAVCTLRAPNPLAAPRCDSPNDMGDEEMRKLFCVIALCGALPLFTACEQSVEDAQQDVQEAQEDKQENVQEERQDVEEAQLEGQQNIQEEKQDLEQAKEEAATDNDPTTNPNVPPPDPNAPNP
jgi:hypothetical protein